MRTIRYKYFRPKKLGKKSKEFYVFDVETGEVDNNGNIHYMLSARPEHFIFGVVYGKNYYRVITTVESFRREFKKKRYKNKIVYAHNAEYDLSCIFDNIYKADPTAIFNGKFICMSNKNCSFADSYNILPTSVRNLGELLGIPKQELGKNLKSHVTKIDTDIAYCTRDCEIVYKSLEKIFEEIEPSFTIGSLSLKLFRKKYLKETVKINSFNDDFFSAYYGGRTEAFYLGECNGKVYDINSAYPWAMANGSFINPSTIKSVSPTFLQKYLADEKYNGMASVIVEVDDEYPVLPFRHDGKLIFPCGKFSGEYMLSELRYALKNSNTKIIECDSLLVSRVIQSPFTEFVSDIYTKRNASTNEFEKYYLKLFLNNLYGKLVQRSKEAYMYCANELDAMKHIRQKKIKHAELRKVHGGYFLVYEQNKFFDHVIPAWGAEITARVRIKLHEAIKNNSKKILYCDTDSIFTNGKAKIKLSSDLGGWKLEGKRIKEIRALKDYVFYKEDGELAQKLKGVKKDAVPYDEYGNVFVYKRMIKTRESFARKDNLPPGTFIDQTKFISGDYKKRQILKGGKTKPFYLKMI